MTLLKLNFAIAQGRMIKYHKYLKYFRFGYWFSFVPFNMIKVTQHVKLSVANLCQWLGVMLIAFDSIITWQDTTKIQLRFHLFDPEKERRWKQRTSFGPGTYEPLWTPKLSLDIGIRGYPFEYCWLMAYKKPESCINPQCGFSSPRKDKLKRHIACCRDTTEVVAKKVCYGIQTEQSTIVPRSFLTSSKFLFAVFDIETAERPSTNAEVSLRIFKIS